MKMLVFCLCVGSASAAGFLAKSRKAPQDTNFFRYDMFPSDRAFPRGRNQGPDFPTQFEEKGVAPGYQSAGGHASVQYVQQQGFAYHEPGKVPTFAEFQDEEAERKSGEKEEKAENPALFSRQQAFKRQHALDKQEADAEWAVWRQKHGKLTRQEREQKEEAEQKEAEGTRKTEGDKEAEAVGMMQQSDEDDTQATARVKLFATAKATKNCRILDNPVSVFKCKEELENEENSEIDTAKASHNCGKLASAQERSLCLDRQKHSESVRLNEMPLAGDQDVNGYDEQAMNVPRKDLARWGETKMSNEAMDH